MLELDTHVPTQVCDPDWVASPCLSCERERGVLEEVCMLVVEVDSNVQCSCLLRTYWNC